MKEVFQAKTVGSDFKRVGPDIAILPQKDFIAKTPAKPTMADKLLIRSWMTAATTPRLYLKKKEPGNGDNHDITGDDLADLLPDLTPEERRKVAERINSTEASATDVAEGILDDPEGYTE